MLTVTLVSDKKIDSEPPKEYLAGKRHLTAKEVYTLIQNRNSSSDPDWKNVYVSDGEGEFCPDQILRSEFNGWVILGVIRSATLKYHDLELKTGVYRSLLENTIIGDDCVVRNVSYLSNYHIGNRVLLFNIQEMSCTSHSKFGEGILKEGEPEENRVWIGVGNENDNRAVLPFTDMITADAFLWSRFREDKVLMQKFIDLTEYTNDKKNDTYGVVENDVVIKNCTLLKDARICSCAYIKGAFKLKNITVLSSEDEVSQIGEGVELVNGIMGYGSRVFYQAVAVRFVIGRNCQLKYGARLLNSVLGDNSTVSCCEMLNNLIFPFHEQHHNSSFLIATTIMGQSNIAAGATIGSNHNSRSPDGEIYAGRGFWPGLCSDFKHNSRFASFTLVAKGSYPYELDVPYPFALVAPGGTDKPVHVLPAYWFLSNLFALARNRGKFLRRDGRVLRVQHIETDPLAPDTMQEIMDALDRLAALTTGWTGTGPLPPPERVADGMRELLTRGTGETQPPLVDAGCQRRYGAVILKPATAARAYRRFVTFFAVRTLVEFGQNRAGGHLEPMDLADLARRPLYRRWTNLGGQIVPEERVSTLRADIGSGRVGAWTAVHARYDAWDQEYPLDKARYVLDLLERLYGVPTTGDFRNNRRFQEACDTARQTAEEILAGAIRARTRDFTDPFRTMTYRNPEEMRAVIGTPESDPFFAGLRTDMTQFLNGLDTLLSGLRVKST